MTHITSIHVKIISLTILSSVLASCEGTFEWVYDNIETEEQTTAEGQIYLDASDWKKWYYIDLPRMAEAAKTDSAYNVNDDIVAYDIPTEATGQETTEHGERHDIGQYSYYFDVFNEGLKNNHFVSFRPTEAQQEPETWSIAIHRNNVRTNGCGAYETELYDIEKVSHEMCIAVEEWNEDQWSENEVWDDQETMLTCVIPCQGIEVNRTLSAWLAIEIPPTPPAFTMNSHVMLLRLPDATYAALQLTDYMNAQGKKCCLTIKYKYPI